MDIYSVLIIGAGKIGAFFDTPESERFLTHAHAFSSHPGFRVVGFVDVDPAQARRAAEVWGGEAFDSLAAACAGLDLDVAVVAAPDEFHYDLLKDLAGFPLRLVFAEKPLTKKLVEAEEIIALYRERGIALGLNYTRRFVPEFAALKGDIEAGRFGRFLTGTGYYGKGTLHNGSHMVDLLRFLLGEVAAIQTISPVHDYYEDDPSCSAVLSMANSGHVYMQAVDCRYYTMFELDLLFEQGRVRVVDAGFRIEIFEVRESDIFAGYRNLNLSGVQTTGLGSAFSHAAERIHTYLSSGAPLPCSGADGIKAQQICASILETLQ